MVLELQRYIRRLDLKSDFAKSALAILLLLTVVATVFGYTVEIRKPWFGVLSTELWRSSSGHHQWLTGTLLKFSKNWYRDGPLSLKFAKVENPASIEFPTLESRGIYPSYPSGDILPIYFLSLVEGHEPTPYMVMRYNLLNHLLITVFLSFTVFLFLGQLGFSHFHAFFLSLIPISLELLLPPPLYWHQSVFFSDQAVILPFVLFIFLEVIRGSVRNKKASVPISLAQGLVLFYGILTDWLFVFVSLVVYTKRVLCGEAGRGARSLIKAGLKYWFPVAAALSLFVLQLYSLGVLGALKGKFLFRSGLSERGAGYVPNFFGQFWQGHIACGYGKVAVWFLWGSLVAFFLGVVYACVQRLRTGKVGLRVKKTLSLMGIVLLPCFAQVYALRNHSVIHDFSALKFSVPLAIVPFILVPILLCAIVGLDFSSISLGGLRISYNKRKKNVEVPLLVLGVLCGAVFYAKTEHVRFAEFFPDPDPSLLIIGRFIDENTQFEDVAFSPDFEISYNPPQQLSYSMKRVYKVATIFDIYDKVNGIDGDFVINIFTETGNLGVAYGLEELVGAADSVRRGGGLTLYKIGKDKFFEEHTEARGRVMEEARQVIAEFSGDDGWWDVCQARESFGFIKNIDLDLYEGLHAKCSASAAVVGDIRSVGEELSFIDYRYEMLNTGKYRFYFLFKVEEKLEKDWKVFFHGHVRGEDTELLPEERRKSGFANWDFAPDPPTSKWAVGEYIMVAREIQAMPVSYHVKLGFFISKKGALGGEIDLGWLDLGIDEGTLYR